MIDVEDWAAGWSRPVPRTMCLAHVEGVAHLRAVPRLFVWDQEGCIGQRRQGRQRLSDEFQARQELVS
jgi:hypothetical protein